MTNSSGSGSNELPVVRYDIFPAVVTSHPAGASLYSSVRVLVTLDEVHIYDETLQEIYSAGLDDGWEDGAVLFVEPDDGTGAFSVVRSGGCGCGSRLKSFRPWNGNYVTTSARFSTKPKP